jgi:hypothetical protein
MAAAIVDFEARRDRRGHLEVYLLREDDGGGQYEVAGINNGYHKGEADKLVELIRAGRFDEAEQEARDFIATYTDVVANWSKVPAVESYLRDSAFNRGPRGAARILQRALGVHDDGKVGDITLSALRPAESEPRVLLSRLRAAREQYERDVVRRDESSDYWRGFSKPLEWSIEGGKQLPMTLTTSRIPAPRRSTN